MIRAIGLGRTYGSVTAVDSVTFEIGAREIVGLLGHNGAGKTTIMKMITGYLEPSSGSVTVNGADVWTERSAVQRQIGYLPENCPLYPEMTVLDYLDYAAALRGVPEEKRLEKIGYVIRKTNLLGVAERYVNTLSRGYKQRLGVAQAILHSPSIVILDEPTNGLDPSQILEMRSLIKELSETATIVVSTHILQEVQAVCGRVIIINNGKLALDSSIADLQKTGRLRIATDAEPARLRSIVEAVPALASARLNTGTNHNYTLHPDTNAGPEIAAEIARRLIEDGCKLFALTPEVQDLESIFAEITAGGSATPQSSASQPSPAERSADQTTGNAENPPADSPPAPATAGNAHSTEAAENPPADSPPAPATAGNAASTEAAENPPADSPPASATAGVADSTEVVEKPPETTPEMHLASVPEDSKELSTASTKEAAANE